MDYIQIIGNASLMVKFVLLLLLFFSVMSWAIIIIKIRYIRKAFQGIGHLYRLFLEEPRSWPAPLPKPSSSAEARWRVFSASDMRELRKLNPSGKPGEEQVSDESTPSLRQEFFGQRQRETRPSSRHQYGDDPHHPNGPFLATTGNTTPFIGLFGTVWGIMNSFHGIGQRGSASLAVVAPGISEALVATAAGLAVAIPAVIAFNHFMQKIRVIETELHSFSADFLNILDRDILR
jgi:biopolymer transport protein TolQ